ncbi:MAG: GAF domain-containing protein, partial [Delftia sp.]|nr:GAF domain-containing protein [Delftia sp.]
YISDDPPRSAVFVPLVAGETVIGAMAIQSYRTAAFSQEHQQVLSIIANQAAAAIANARLYHAERRRREMADTLRQISVLLNSSLDTGAVLRGILEGLERLVSLEGAAILLLDEEKKTLTLQAARGLPALEEAVGTSWPVGDGQRVRLLAEAQQALLFGSNDEMGPYHQLLGLPDDHSCLGAPILIRDQLLGVLTVDSREPDQYDAQDAALVAALAG